MSDVERTLDHAEWLLGLSPEVRKAQGQALNQALMAGMDDEEIGKPPVRTLGEYLDTPVEKPPILVEPGIVALGAITALISRGGKGKTAVSLNRLVRWSMGKPLFDELPDLMKPTKPLRILVIENEGNGGHFQMILGRILGENKFKADEVEMARENVHIWGDGGWSGLKLDEERDYDMVNRAVRETDCDLLFVEPFRGLWKGDENNSTDMAVVCDSLTQIAVENDCGAMLTHHERKSGVGEGESADPMSAARGSGVLEGAAAVMERWVPVKGGRQREMVCIKNRFDDEYAPFRMEYERDRWGYRYVAEDEKLRTVKGVLAQDPGQWFTVLDVANELDETDKRTRGFLNALAEDSDQPVDKQRSGGAQLYRYKGNGADPGDGGIAI